MVCDSKTDFTEAIRSRKRVHDACPMMFEVSVDDCPKVSEVYAEDCPIVTEMLVNFCPIVYRKSELGRLPG